MKRITSRRLSTLLHSIQKSRFTCSSIKYADSRASSKSKPFPVIDGTIDKTSDEFKKNQGATTKLTDQYLQILAKSQAGGGEMAIARHVKQNKKLLVSDRVKMLLDDMDEFLELSPIAGHSMEYGDIARAGGIMDRVKMLLDDMDEFLELSPIAGHSMEYGDIARAGGIMGIGKIHGKYCMIIANDGTVKGGTVFPITLKKQLRAQEIAQQNRLPCVYAVDSGGAFLPLQSEIFNPGGMVFYNEAIMGAMGIPQIAIVCGSCTAGGAYVPTMADQTVIIHRIGTIFLGGPPLVQAATGEIISAEELGGATLHSKTSGCTDYFAATEEEGFATGRDIVETLNLPDYRNPQRASEDPLFDPAELSGIIPHKHQENMDLRKVISRIVDGSRFQEFKTLFGENLVAGFAHIQGYLVGIIGNNGEMTDTAAAKGAHFVNMCSERYIPLIFLHNTTSSDSSNMTGAIGGNYLRDHAKLMSAISCSQVPKISVVVGNSIGNANYLMCGRSSSPNFMFSWPNAISGLMEKTQLVQSIVQEKFPSSEVDSTEKTELTQKLLQKYTIEMSSFYISSRVLDDGIILPENTRNTLGRCLDIMATYVQRQPTQHPVTRM